MGARGVVGIAVVVVAGGALLFGLWHVVVGGFVNANPRAAEFGLTLAAGSAAFLGALLLAVRRSPGRASRRDVASDRGAGRRSRR